MLLRNLLLTLAFEGTNYHGWQVQKNAITVQQVVQDALENILGTRPDVTGCSRTDAGVHANMYCCTAKTKNPIGCNKLVLALNSILPKDIAVSDCKEVSDDFHPRYSALKKEYIYQIWNYPFRNPFFEEKSLHCKYPIDIDLLNLEAKDFLGEHDFLAFCASGSSITDTVRTVYECSVKRQDNLITITISANGFLYNMVRIMVGTLLDISKGKIRAGSLPEIIASRNRNMAGITVPAYGLFLNRVFY
jgi:tRNA pseudouridine38-40 synthase